jgi:DNA adenine methylase
METPRTKPFIKRAGGKTCLLEHLLPRIPETGVKCYVEAFGGGAALLLARKRTPGTVEVYNDIDAELVNAFRQVRHHGPEVIRCLGGRINSRRDFIETRDATHPRTEVQRAADWIWRNRISFGGDAKVFGVQKTGGGGAASRITTAQDLINAAAVRLEGVIVEELPWQRLVKNYDSPATFFFFDPPYFGDKQKDYKGWTRPELEELIDALRGLKGRWMMTFGDHPGVRELFRGWKVTPVDRQSAFKKDGNSRRYHELIIEPA